MFKKILKWVFIIAGIGFLSFVGYVIAVLYAFGVFDRDYNRQDLIEHYESRTAEIQNLKAYYESIVPANKTVKIEFDGNRELGIFHILSKDSLTGKSIQNSNWDLKIKSPKVDSMIASLGWSQETLKTLKLKLDEADCISVTNSSPFNIGFQRSGMGMYFYNLFDQPIPDSLVATYNDGYTYVLYTDRVVLEYGGGAVGPQCFPGLKYQN